ncbi:hypothetical protein BSNK01_32070 [Bacillaceae bacterium]
MRKKCFAVKGIWLFASLLWFTACQPSPEPAEETIRFPEAVVATVAPANLSAEAKTLLPALGLDHVLVFDVMLRGAHVSRLSIWLEVFEKGNEQPRAFDFEVSLAEREGKGKKGNGRVVFAFDSEEMKEEDKERRKVIGAWIDNSGVASAANALVAAQSPKGRLVTPLSEKREIGKNEPVTLAQIIEDDGSAVSSGDLWQYDAGKAGKEIFSPYDRMYLLRMEIKE